MRTDRICVSHIKGAVEVHMTSKEAFLHVLRFLHEGSSARFLPDLAEMMRGTRRNHLARRPEDVYPLEKSWDEHVIELVPGWYIGLNCNDGEKDRWLREACDLRGKVYGPGQSVWVRWPNEIKARREVIAQRRGHARPDGLAHRK